MKEKNVYKIVDYVFFFKFYFDCYLEYKKLKLSMKFTGRKRTEQILEKKKTFFFISLIDYLFVTVILYFIDWVF